MGLVQQIASALAGSGSTVTATFASTPTAGNTIVIITNNFSSRTVLSISITNGIGPVRLAHDIFASLSSSCEMWAIIAGASSGTLVTLNLSGAANSRSINISEWSGLAATVIQDGALQFAHFGAGSTSLTTPAYTAAVPGDLVICCAATGNTFSTDPGSPYTSFSAPAAAFHASFNFGASSGAQPTGTWTTPSSAGNTLIAAIEAPSPPLPPPILLVTAWPPIDYIPAPLPHVPVVVGGPPPQTNWFAPLAVTPWPSPDYGAASLPHVPAPSAATLVPSILAVTPWATTQYPAVNLSQIEPPVTGPFFPSILPVSAWPTSQYPASNLSLIEPAVTGPFFPSPLVVTPYPPPSYAPLDLLKVPPSPAGPAALTGIKISFRGIKRRPQNTP